MRTPDAARAREQAALFLATVVDPSPAPTPEAASAEPLAAERLDADDQRELIDPTESSLLPAAELLVTMGSAYVASKFGDSWLVTPERATRIARSLVRLAHKYLPSSEAYGPEIECGIALGDWALAGMGPALSNVAAIEQREVVQP